MDYETLRERYERGYMLSEKEYDYLANCVKELVKTGSPLEPVEYEILFDSCGEEIDNEILDVGKHNWILYRVIIKIDNRYFSMKYWQHEYKGNDFVENSLQEVVPREVTVTQWVVKDEKFKEDYNQSYL